MELDADLPSGSGRVLLVDDDPDVRATVRLMLEVLGYEVAEVGDGLAALAFLGAAAMPDLVVLDLEMPGMRGEEVLVRIRAQYPTLPVVVSTGWRRDSLEDLAVAGFLHKPFTVAEVGRVVRDALAKTGQ